jgi:hypothetical protein
VRDKEGRLVAPTLGPPKKEGLQLPESLEQELKWMEPMKGMWGQEKYDDAVKLVISKWESGERIKQLEKLKREHEDGSQRPTAL